MTPLTYSTLALLSRWQLMLVELAGGPVPEPPPPPRPGRVHQLPWSGGVDPVRQRWDLEHGVDGEGSACD